MVGESTKAFYCRVRDRWKRGLLVDLAQENKVDSSLAFPYPIVREKGETSSFT